MDAAVADEGGVRPTIQDRDVDFRPIPVTLPGLGTYVDEGDIVLHQRSRSNSIDQEHPQFGRASKRTN